MIEAKHPSTYDMDRDVFRQRLSYLIDDKNTYGITQNQMADEMGVSKGSITAWKNGINTPTADFVFALARYFDVRSDWLLGLDDNDKSPKERDVVALTGLSDDAVANLITINEKRLPAFAKEIMSKILASPSFIEFIMSYYEYVILCDVLQKELETYENSNDPYKDNVFLSSIYEREKLLKFGRFEIAEKCMKILNDIRPIDKTLSTAEEVIRKG